MYKINHIRIGDVDSYFNGEHKFVLSRVGDSLVYHAKATPCDQKEICKRIMSEDDILGFGLVWKNGYDSSRLYVRGVTGNAREIPKEILELFKPELLKTYKTLLLSLDEIFFEKACNCTDINRWLSEKNLLLNERLKICV